MKVSMVGIFQLFQLRMYLREVANVAAYTTFMPAGRSFGISLFFDLGAR
jgi:hypothetical protein